MTKEDLAAERKKHGLTQMDLAEKLGVSRQTVSKWETGAAFPSSENLIALSQLYGISIDGMMFGEPAHQEEETPPPEPEPGPSARIPDSAFFGSPAGVPDCIPASPPARIPDCVPANAPADVPLDPLAGARRNKAKPNLFTLCIAALVILAVTIIACFAIYLTHGELNKPAPEDNCVPAEEIEGEEFDPSIIVKTIPWRPLQP